MQQDWNFWARESQLEPTDPYKVWFVMGGRGSGKTRTGGEYINKWARSGKYGRIAIVGSTVADARDVMIEGESGILETAIDGHVPIYQPSKRKITWPNGAIAKTYSAEDPGTLRGPSHDLAWCDEIAKWKYPEWAWDNLMLGLRLGTKPKCLVTGTPRPIKIVRNIIADPETITVVWHTIDNKDNLSESYIKHVYEKYGNSRIGRQELEAEILEDNPNALWSIELLDRHRVKEAQELKRIVIGLDPATTSKITSNYIGLIVTGQASDGHCYVIHDASLKATPAEWARRAIDMYYAHGADCIVAEVNQGGDMVETVIHNIDDNVHVKKVHADRNKIRRASPISVKYEQGLVHHVGVLPKLEDELTMYDGDPKSSPTDRLDAVVWALRELFKTASISKVVGGSRRRLSESIY